MELLQLLQPAQGSEPICPHPHPFHKPHPHPQLFYVFSVMELLQLLQYTVLGDCGSALNQATTLASREALSAADPH